MAEFAFNNGWQIKTPGGWSEFVGVKKTQHSSYAHVKFCDPAGTVIDVTLDHKLKLSSGEFVEAQMLVAGQELSTGAIIEAIEIIDKNIDMFDALDVKKNHEYITNGVVSSNCAWIRGFDALWTGLQPTLSMGGRCILISTPNGVGNQFHKIYSDAEAGLSEVKPIRLPWDVHPEHDQKWFEQQKRELGSRKKVSQELLCEFITSGDTFLTPDDIEWVGATVEEPIDKWGADKSLWVWKYPIPDHKYVIPADVARGDGADCSAFHVIDMDEAEVVAEYKGRIPPDEFALLLEQTGKKYNVALLCPERNSFGYTTVLKLRDLQYPRVFKDDSKAVYITAYNPIGEDPGKSGFDTNGRTRIQILSKLEEIIRNKLIKVRSARFYDELKTFVWTGNRAQATKGRNDDLVMAMAIGMWIYDVADGYNKRDANIHDVLMGSMGVTNHTFNNVPGSGHGVAEFQKNYNPYHAYVTQAIPIKVNESEAMGKDPRFNHSDFSWLVK